MKYILQMVVDEGGWQNLTPEQMQPMIDEIERYNDQLRNGGVWVSGEGFDYSSNAKTVRASNGERSVKDGPAFDSKEQIAGYWIIEVDDIDDAVKWAKLMPMQDGSVEVRGLVPEDAVDS